MSSLKPIIWFDGFLQIMQSENELRVSSKKIHCLNAGACWANVWDAGPTLSQRWDLVVVTVVVRLRSTDAFIWASHTPFPNQMRIIHASHGRVQNERASPPEDRKIIYCKYPYLRTKTVATILILCVFCICCIYRRILFPGLNHLKD